MAATIAVLSQKGGTGKTTAVRTLTDVFRRIDLHVLAVDLDPQGNLSDYLDVDPDASPTIGDVLTGRRQGREADPRRDHPRQPRARRGRAGARRQDGPRADAKKALREVADDYDVILIDCPPALGLLTVNALVASDYALLSAEAQYFALQGVEQALEVIELARDSLNPDLEWLGVVLNIADMRTRHSREAFDSLREHFGDKLIHTTIRASIAYAESAERALSILDYRPDLGADYLDVADELLARLGLDDRPPAPGGAASSSLRLSTATGPSAGSDGAARARGRRRPATRTATRSTLAQPSRLAPERCDHAPGLLEVAPEQHASAPRRRSSRRARPAAGARSSSVGRARVQVRAVGLVQPVAQPGRDQVPVAARQAEHQQRRAARR